MDKAFRIGVLGCANIARRSVIPAIKNKVDKFKLIAVASRTIDKAQSFADQFNCEAIEGYDNLIKRQDIDALYIPLPTGLHEEWVLKALENNKHVLTEKSLAIDVKSAKKMIDQARSSRLVLIEDFMYRYHSQHQYVWKHLKEGAIGELRFFRSNFGFPPLPPDNFRYDKELGGGALLDAAAYTVNAARWFLGNELEVGCSNLFFDRARKVCIHGTTTLYSKSTGLAAQLVFGFDNVYQCNYELYGSDGLIHSERSFTPPPDFSPRIIMKTKTQTIEHLSPPDNHFENIIDHFYQLIERGQFDEESNDNYHQSRILTEVENKAVISYI